jgi:hypothetical protein
VINDLPYHVLNQKLAANFCEGRQKCCPPYATDSCFVSAGARMVLGKACELSASVEPRWLCYPSSMWILAVRSRATSDVSLALAAPGECPRVRAQQESRLSVLHAFTLCLPLPNLQLSRIVHTSNFTAHSLSASERAQAASSPQPRLHCLVLHKSRPAAQSDKHCPLRSWKTLRGLYIPRTRALWSHIHPPAKHIPALHSIAHPDSTEQAPTRGRGTAHHGKQRDKAERHDQGTAAAHPVAR